MAALTFFACNAFRQIYEFSHFFIGSGFSFSRSLLYLRVKRDRYLFQKYREELWDIQCNDSEQLSSEFVISSDIRIKQKQFAKLSAKDTFATAEMSREIDFTAVEYPTDEPWEGCRSGYDYQVDDFGDIEIVDGQEVTDGSTFYDYVETLPVYSNNNLGSIKEGVSFTIAGYILPNCERFSINLILETPTRDIALHVNPRLPQNYIVRNSRVKNVWGGEEVSSALPFSLHRGSKFAIQILITDSCYMISVNGHHFAEFNHRLPYKSVGCLEVKGDVDNISFNRTEASKYPERLPESKAKEIRVNLEAEDQIDTCTPPEWKLITLSATKNVGLQLPYYGLLPPKSFGSGKCLRIEGRVKLLPHSFYVNLQGGQDIWPHPIIAFHFNPRFAKHGGGIGKHVVCRNAWYNGAWAKEERTELTTDFCPGKSFSLVIVCGMASYEVYVNKKLITEFRFHVDPEIVDTVYVQGDIKLWDVVLENHSTANGAEKRIYQNPAYQEDY